MTRNDHFGTNVMGQLGRLISEQFPCHAPFGPTPIDRQYCKVYFELSQMIFHTMVVECVATVVHGHLATL